MTETNPNALYRVYSDALREKYGCKVYRLPINLPVTCPNRINGGGCAYCSPKGAGFESLPDSLSVREQLDRNRAYIGKKYHAEKFIAYFQNYTNTFLPPADFAAAVREAAECPGVAELAVSTRPDCIAAPYLDILADVRRKYGVEITVELGLQTANYKTLEELGRGHTLAEFADARLQILPYNFGTCAHVIADLPQDTAADVIETAKLLSALRFSEVKLHSLYIPKGTPLARAYEAGTLCLLPPEEYIERCVTFLEYLDPHIVIARLVGRAPEEDTLICNHHISWWKIKEAIEEKMRRENRHQGDKFDYLGGKFVRRWCGETV